ncbi:MAG TPA: MMPL family transporter [Solirubrobacteraceae bacterium]
MAAVARLAGRLFRAVGRVLARIFVAFRYPVILAWIGGAVVAAIALPALGGSDVTSFADLVPPHSSALQAEQVSTHEFGFPLLSETVIVIRNSRGLPASRTARLVSLAARLSSDRVPGFSSIEGAIPLVNAVGGGPAFSPEHDTTALLYLLFKPSAVPYEQQAVAARLLSTRIGHLPGEYEGYTGPAPAEQYQANKINTLLNWVSLGTILLVALAIAVHFRAPGAALLTVGAVAISYLLANRVIEQFGRLGGVSIPAEAQPVLVVLVFGMVTDYSIFFMSRARTLLGEGRKPRTVGLALMREIVPIIAVAGVTVAVGTAALEAASIRYLRGFGPGLAIAVLIAMVVATTFVPAALSAAGRWIFWPARLEPAQEQVPASARPARRRWSIRMAVRHPVVTLIVVLALVGAAASGLSRLAVGNALVRDLPAGSEVHQAYAQASRGFSQGVLAPGELVITGSNVAGQRAALSRLQPLIARQPDMAQVFGPRQIPLARRLGFSLARSGTAARLVFFLRSDPLGATGISAVETLRGRLPDLVRQAGLTGVSAAVAGDTALSADIVGGTIDSLERVIPVVLLAIFVIIALYLRALVAPLYLVLTSLLGVAASLGLTVWVLQVALGWGQIDYYVLFTVGVLLISLGSDYNVFLVGRIWQQARRRWLGEAIEVGASRASRPITTAGFVLASSFALLVIVPLRPFREIAFAMAVGLLVDTLLVRTVLVPALLSLVGARSAWPGHALRETPTGPTEEAPTGPTAVPPGAAAPPPGAAAPDAAI